MKFIQCLLTRNNTFIRSYIPEEYAVLNSRVKLRNILNEWENNWTVCEVSSIKVDEKNLPDSHKEIKGHRKKTGDSQPKDREERLK